MTHKKAILDFLNRGDKKSREVGRYWSSEIHAILKGYLTPQSFFDAKEIDSIGAARILSGMAFESMLHLVYKKQNIKYEKGGKKELQITPEITLVVKPDFIFEDRVIETKFPERLPEKKNEVPDKYKYQLECEYQAYKLPVVLGLFSHPFSVEFIPYKNSERRWSNIVKGLVAFHEELVKIK